MTHWPLRPLAGRCLVVLCSALLAGAADDGIFMQSAGPIDVEQRTTLKPPGSSDVAVDYVRFKPADGVSDAAFPELCGLVARGGDGKPKPLITIGTGRTRYSTCDGLSEAGLVTTGNGGWRLGLIYNTSTPGGTTTTAIVVAPDKDGTLRIDPAASYAQDVETLAELKALLRRQRHR